MNVENIVGLISKSTDRLNKAIELSRRDEKWWAFMGKESWNLIQLSWALRGAILKRGQGTGTEESLLHQSDKVKKEIEDILKKAEETSGG